MQTTKNLLGFQWFESRQAKSGVRRPPGYPEKKISKVAIVGAGLMGGGIAYACAVRGIETVLKDISLDVAEKGKSYTMKVLERNAGMGIPAAGPPEVILGRILATDKYQDCAGAELVIEAVFEKRELKQRVYGEIEPCIHDGSVIASNTSSLPITDLAGGARDKGKFIGIHFFSPVDRMELVELIRGKETSEETIALAFDFIMQIDKTPILVNDSRGFFTSRVFQTFTREGVRMVAEGVPAAIVENAARLAGWPVGPLEVRDNVGLRLTLDVIEATKKDYAAEGRTFEETPSELLIAKMVNEFNRLGRSSGKGFYDWAGGRKSLWPGLKALERPEVNLPLNDVKDRMFYIQSLEAVKLLDENVIETTGEANVGSILGIGFPRWTGGVIQFINTMGVAEFIMRAQELAGRYGKRFDPPPSLKAMAARGEVFPHGVIVAQGRRPEN
jgi:3-hydroxyacyl-CoA dehydrogenase/enoyl-CoA hydratase/3-hydroxybutyryl-CoA epimerase